MILVKIFRCKISDANIYDFDFFKFSLCSKITENRRTFLLLLGLGGLAVKPQPAKNVECINIVRSKAYDRKCL